VNDFSHELRVVIGNDRVSCRSFGDGADCEISASLKMFAVIGMAYKSRLFVIE
jgi:hypothetical protein